MRVIWYPPEISFGIQMSLAEEYSSIVTVRNVAAIGPSAAAHRMMLDNLLQIQPTFTLLGGWGKGGGGGGGGEGRGGGGWSDAIYMVLML